MSLMFKPELSRLKGQKRDQKILKFIKQVKYTDSKQIDTLFFSDVKRVQKCLRRLQILSDRQNINRHRPRKDGGYIYYSKHRQYIPEAEKIISVNWVLVNILLNRKELLRQGVCVRILKFKHNYQCNANLYIDALMVLEVSTNEGAVKMTIPYFIKVDFSEEFYSLLTAYFQTDEYRELQKDTGSNMKPQIIFLGQFNQQRYKDALMVNMVDLQNNIFRLQSLQIC